MKKEINNTLVKIGTVNGGWDIPNNIINENSVVYCVGAGEDISFDVGIVTTYGCNVRIYDPTPRAKIHFDTLNSEVNKGNKFAVNSSDKDFYEIAKEKLDLLNFNQLGLWDKKETLKFYSPKNENHVSHSILNLQKTSNYFNAEVNRLSTIMKINGDVKIDVLKIDIEGAEYKVLESIIEDKLDINVICVEYDEFNCPLDNQCINRIKESINKVVDSGYEVIHINGNTDYTFMKKELI